MSFGVSPNDITRLAQLSRITYINWRARHGRLNNTAVDLRALRDVLEHVKRGPLDPNLLSKIHVEDVEDWTRLFKQCNSVVGEFSTHLAQDPAKRLRIFGRLTISRRNVPDKIRCKLRNARSWMAMFLFAFGYESLTDVDRVFNDLELFRRMHEIIDESLAWATPSGRAALLLDGNSGTGEAWWQVMLAERGYTVDQVNNATPALKMYLRRSRSRTATSTKRPDGAVGNVGLH